MHRHAVLVPAALDPGGGDEAAEQLASAARGSSTKHSVTRHSMPVRTPEFHAFTRRKPACPSSAPPCDRQAPPRKLGAIGTRRAQDTAASRAEYRRSRAKHTGVGPKPASGLVHGRTKPDSEAHAAHSPRRHAACLWASRGRPTRPAREACRQARSFDGASRLWNPPTAAGNALGGRKWALEHHAYGRWLPLSAAASALPGQLS